jgi:hypothetical protein
MMVVDPEPDLSIKAGNVAEREEGWRGKEKMRDNEGDNER